MTVPEFTHPHPRVQSAIDNELARLARATANIEQACDDGRISESDRDERIARREQEALNYIAHVRGDRRPKQRERKPLDDPGAHRVG